MVYYPSLLSSISSCMVKITPNSPNLDHAKFFLHGLCFLKAAYSSKEGIFLTVCAILCLFSNNQKQKKIVISVENDVLSAEINP